MPALELHTAPLIVHFAAGLNKDPLVFVLGFLG
jgi:hypothetical protein